MPLIDGPLVEVPETDDWEDSLAARILLGFTALLLWRMGLRIMGNLYPEQVLGAVLGVALFAIGTQLLIFAVTDLDLETWGPRISYGVLAVIGLALLLAMLDGFMGSASTDALLFSRLSAEGLLAGTNPYTMDFSSAFAASKVGYGTPRIDGSTVSQLSYPVGSVLAFIPQAATIGAGPIGYGLTLLVLGLATAGFVTSWLPAKLAIAGPVFFLGARNTFLTAAGGIFWPLWLLPLLLGFRAWYRERWTRAAVWLGISLSVKQFALFLVPFLAIWQFHETDTWTAFARRAGRLSAAGLAPFLLINGPFIIWHPAAWVDGVLTPLAGAAPMVQQGSGLALLAFVGVFDAASWWWTLAVAVTATVALTAYALYFERVRWAAWLVVPVVMFPYWRSMINYFVPWGAVALVCIFAAWGRLEIAPVADTARQPQGVVADD